MWAGRGVGVGGLGGWAWASWGVAWPAEKWAWPRSPHRPSTGSAGTCPLVFKSSSAVLTLTQFPFAPPPPATFLLGAHMSHHVSFQTKVQRAHSGERREPEPHRAPRVQILDHFRTDCKGPPGPRRYSHVHAMGGGVLTLCSNVRLTCAHHHSRQDDTVTTADAADHTVLTPKPSTCTHLGPHLMAFLR